MASTGQLQEKLLTAAQAVDRYVADGAMVALGGFTVSRNPMALAREIVRQGKRDLHLVCHSQGQALDLLIGAGCVIRLEVAYAGLGRFAPTMFRFKKAVLEGRLEVEDYSNFQMTLRFLAGGLGLPFVPTVSGLETDIVHKTGFPEAARTTGQAAAKKLVVQADPFDPQGRPVLLLPALNPDVALLHAQYVGQEGTVRLKGLTFADLEIAKSAKALLVSCEAIVPEAFLRADPDQNHLPGFLVDAVILQPYGAHPTACYGHYDYDPGHLNMLKRVAPEDGPYQEYLAEWITGPADEAAYLAKVGVETLLRIKANPALGYAPGLDRR